MPRLTRPGWKPMNLTLSQEVRDFIKLKGRGLRVDLGTVADRIIRAQLGMATLEDIDLGICSPGIAGRLRDEYAACAKKPKRIAGFLYAHAYLSPGPKIFSPLMNLKVTTPRAGDSITSKMFHSIVERAIAATGFKPTGDLDNRTVRVLDTILQSIDRLFGLIARKYPLHADRKEIWTTSSSGAFGILLGEQLKPFIEKDNHEGAADVAVQAVIEMIGRFLKSKNDDWFRDSPKRSTQLAFLIILHGGLDAGSDEDDGSPGQFQGIFS